MNATTTTRARATNPSDLLALQYGELVYYPLSHEHDLTHAIADFTSFDVEEADLHFIDVHSYDSQDGEYVLHLALEKDVASAMAS